MHSARAHTHTRIDTWAHYTFTTRMRTPTLNLFVFLVVLVPFIPPKLVEQHDDDAAAATKSNIVKS